MNIETREQLRAERPLGTRCAEKTDPKMRPKTVIGYAKWNSSPCCVRVRHDGRKQGWSIHVHFIDKLQEL